MSFFGKIFSHLFQDAAVTRLANTKAFQVAAMKTVEMQRALQQASKTAADDPAAARAAVAEGAQSFWSHLKAEISRDVAAFTGDGKAGDPADAAKALQSKAGGAGGRAAGGAGGGGGGRLA